MYFITFAGFITYVFFCVLMTFVYLPLLYGDQAYDIYNTNYDKIAGGGRVNLILNFTITNHIIDHSCPLQSYKLIGKYNSISCIIDEDTCFSAYDIETKYYIGAFVDINFDASCPEICDTIHYTSKKAINAKNTLRVIDKILLGMYVIALILAFFTRDEPQQTNLTRNGNYGNVPQTV